MDKDTLPYRPCVGVLLANRDGLIFGGERIDAAGAWQMPQGGIDKGEAARDAALRELWEETGVTADLVAVEAEMPGWVYYDLPEELLGKMWKGKYRGQKQRWYLMRYGGDDSLIKIDTDHPEFARWQWMEPDALIEAIVPFKRAVYEQVINHFREVL